MSTTHKYHPLYCELPEDVNALYKTVYDDPSNAAFKLEEVERILAKEDYEAAKAAAEVREFDDAQEREDFLRALRAKWTMALQAAFIKRAATVKEALRLFNEARAALPPPSTCNCSAEQE